MQLQHLKQIHATPLNPFILFGFQLSFSLLKTPFSPSFHEKIKIKKAEEFQDQSPLGFLPE